MEKTLGKLAVAILTMASTLVLPSNRHAYCEDSSREVQIVFSGNTHGLLEPCG